MCLEATMPATFPALRVTGVCPSCQHVVHTEAAKGAKGQQLSTWRGACPKCGAHVVARRARDTPKPTAPPAATEPAGPPAPAGRKRVPPPIPKVEAYDQPHTPPAVRPGPEVRAGDPGAAGAPAGPEPLRERRPEAVDRGADAGDEPTDRGTPAGGGDGRAPARARAPETGHKRHVYPDLYDW
jgi:hypothetical protein